MRKRYLVLSALVLAGAILWIPYYRNQKTSALQAISHARVDARLNHKVLMVEFEADWCSDCRDLAKSLQEPNIRDYLAKHVDLVKVDVGQFDRNLDVARLLDVDVNQGIPAAFFLPLNAPVSRKTGNSQILDYLHQLKD